MTEESTTPVISWDINKAAIAAVAEELKGVDAYKDLDGAKAAKKQLQKMRTKLGEAHKETKADALAFGRKVDAKKNEYLGLIKEIEDPISEQLDEIKNAEALKEQDRVDAIQAQIERLQAFANDRHGLELDELQERYKTLTDEPIAEEVFQEMYDTAGLIKEDGLMKLRITMQNEKERIEEERKAAEVAAENARQKAELDARQAKMDAEDAERKARQDAEDLERRKVEQAEADERQAEQDKIAAEQAAAQRLIDDENARIAQDKADDEAAERAAEALREEDEARLAAAPDVEKLNAWATALNTQIQPQLLQTDAAKRIQIIGMEKLLDVVKYIINETEKLA